MESIIRRHRTYKQMTTWGVSLVFLSAFIITAYEIHQGQLQELVDNTERLKQRSSLITQLHKQMLLLSRTQYQILHASNHQEARSLLGKLSKQVSDYTNYYYQLERIADDQQDAWLLLKFENEFEHWHELNQGLLEYANIITAPGFISTLAMVDLTFSQLEQDAEDIRSLIAQFEQSVDNDTNVSN